MNRIKSDEPFYQISQVSKLLNITSDRLRTYEEEGLIKPYRARQLQDGKRLFSNDEIEWLEIIRELIKLGVTIPVIRILITSNLEQLRKLTKPKDLQILGLMQKLYEHPVYNSIKAIYSAL